MMTVVDIEKKEKCLKICDKLFENGYIYEIKDKIRADDTSPYVNVMAKTGMIETDDLLKLFKDNGFECFKESKGYYIILCFEKEVENLSAEECFIF